MKNYATKVQGFTLIELIVTIVLGALVLAAVLPFLGDVFLKSYEPRAQLHGAVGLHAAMENLVSRNTNSLALLHQAVGEEDRMLEGPYRVVENRYIAFVGQSESNQVVTNSLLKVTLQNALGETLTRLFTEPP